MKMFSGKHKYIFLCMIKQEKKKKKEKTGPHLAEELWYGLSSQPKRLRYPLNKEGKMFSPLN